MRTIGIRRADVPEDSCYDSKYSANCVMILWRGSKWTCPFRDDYGIEIKTPPWKSKPTKACREATIGGE